MITRRSLAGLAAGAALLPSLAQAQTWSPRRTESFADGFPAPGRRPWAEQVPQLRVGLLDGVVKIRREHQPLARRAVVGA